MFFSGYDCLSYGHHDSSTTKLPEIQEHWYADTARLHELHGDPCVLHCDNALKRMVSHSQYESHQMGTSEHMNRTLETITSTVLLAGCMDKR